MSFRNNETTRVQTQQEHVGPDHFFINDFKLHNDAEFFTCCGNKFIDVPQNKHAILYQK